MITFLTILFVLIGLNTIIMLVSSLQGAAKNIKKSVPEAPQSSRAVIYPINFISPELKKAV